MSVNYTVQADVVDINCDSPKPTDSFLVDTNVWFWLTYSKSSPEAYQSRSYPPYLQKVHKAKATLWRCELSFAELAHRIEKTEHDIYVAANGKLGTKEFRHNLGKERAKVAAEFAAAWALVGVWAAPVTANVNESMTKSSMARFSSEKLDGYDLFMLEAIKSVGIIQVITDDGDYCSVPGIRVFTANHRVIQAAQSQNKLVIR